jgi:retinitis pigmentosa 1
MYIIAVIIYEVTTVTGDLWNAATAANVYITLYGERGDTGVRQLYKPSGEKFKKGQVYSFLENVHR